MDSMDSMSPDGISRDRVYALLSPDECLELLRTASIGRIAYSDRALPAIVLVTYSVVNDTILVRSDSSPAWAVALRNAVVAFQADAVTSVAGAGWNVSCVAKTRSVPGCPDVLLLQPTTITGWRVSPAAALAS